MSAQKGRYIVLEGLDGCGKTTQHALLLKYFSTKAIGVREPGGTNMAEKIRSLIKDGSITRAPRTNAYLFSAARAELVDSCIRPAIAKGKHVIADRNWLSTIAYQTAEGMEKIEEILHLSRLATEEFFYPDLLIFIDSSVQTCQQRLQARGDGAGDYFEAKGPAYFEAVRDAYLQHISHVPHHVIVNGGRSIEVIAADIQSKLKFCSF